MQERASAGNVLQGIECKTVEHYREEEVQEAYTLQGRVGEKALNMQEKESAGSVLQGRMSEKTLNIGGRRSCRKVIVY